MHAYLKYIRPLLYTFTACCFSLMVKAGPKVFDFNARCEQAYQEIMAMRVENGRHLLELEKQQHPDNLIPDFLDNYIDLLQLFFTENKSDYKARLAARDKRLGRMSQGGKDSPFYLYTQAVIHFQWSAVKIKFGERLSAAWEFRKAYLIFRENQRKFPGFTPNNIYIGAMQAVIGTIPNGYKWITNILGMDGSITRGMELLQSYVNDTGAYGQLFKNEAYLYYCYLQFYIRRKPEEVFRFINEHGIDTRNNQLYTFMAVNLAINHQMGSYAMNIMLQRNKGPEFMDMPSLDFEMGMLYLDHLDIDSAILYLKRFTDEFKGNFYIKDALQKLSWAYHLKGDAATAVRYRELVKEKGNAVTDADKSALREAQKSSWPDPDLLRPRLLCDGGYYRQALQMLNRKNVADFSTAAEKIEYAYRLGRIYDELGQADKAMPFYEAAIRGGHELPEYFAARAAWQMGMIYEKRGDKARAINYYNQCLNMQEDEYKNSLDQWAKAGINRLSGK